jgi:hypothetical protein
MDVIYRYRMKGERMAMADMGYVLIDKAGRIRAHRIDRESGEHAGEIGEHLERLSRASAEVR